MKKFVILCVSAGIALGLIKIFSIIPFNRLAADDFAYGYSAMSQGFWQAQVNWYLVWTGKFASTFIQIIFILMSGDSAKAVIYSLIMFGLIFSGLIIFYKRLLNLKARNFYVLLLSGLTFVALYLITPNKSESWYWLSGSVIYLLPLVFLLFGASNLFLAKRKIINYISSFIFIFLASAGNETVGLLTNVVLFLALIAGLASRKVNKLLLTMFIASFISYSLVFFAPGNANRLAGGASNPMSLFGSVLYSIQSGPGVLFSIFKENILFISALFVTLGYLFSTFDKAVKETTEELMSKMFLFLSAPVLLSVMYTIPGFKALGRLPPDRSDITLAFILLISVILASNYLGKLFLKNRLEKSTIFKSAIFAFSLLFFISSFKLVSTLGTDFYIARNYSQAYDNMIQTLKDAEAKHEKGVIKVPVLPGSGLITPAQLRDYPGVWTNDALAKYYGLDAMISK